MVPKSLQRVVLLITVPREEDEDEKKKELKDRIGVVESLYATLGGMKAQKGLGAFLFGRSDHISLETVADREGMVSFYATVPKYMQQYFEEQVQAQYPDSMIEEVEDYNIFTPQGVVIGSQLKLEKSYIFPIKTYDKLNSDPINAITNSLSKFKEKEGAAIQLVIRSAKPEWHAKPAKVASEMQQGKKLQDALKSVGVGAVLKGIGEVGKLAMPKETKPGEAPSKENEPYKLSPMEEEIVKGLEEKTSKAGFDVNIRIIVSCANKPRAESLLKNIVDAFTQFSTYQYGNNFKEKKMGTNKKFIHDYIYVNFNEKSSFILNTAEMASLYHLPLPETETPNIRWLTARKASPPTNLPQEGVVLGECEYRGKKSLVRIKDNDRQRHVYVIGQTGSGKSYTMGNMVVQDILNGEGCCIIDPHGSLIDEYVLPNVPKERADDVVYFDPSDLERPMGLNLMEYDPRYPEQKTFVINEMIAIFDKLYDLKATGGPMFEQYMRNAMQLVMDDPESGSTLLEIPRVLSDDNFRKYKLSKTKNMVVKRFWEEEAEKAGGEASLANMVPYITSKLNTFISNDYMRPIIAQQKSGFNFRKIMDEGKIFLINLSKGRIGDLNAELLGLVFVGKLLMASLSRVDMPESERKPFYLYIDEFQNYITESIAVILSEARKYKLCLNMAHQYVGQLVKDNDTTVKDAVFGNVGTIMAFRVGVEDAELFAKQFEPVFNEFDVMNVEKHTFNLKLLIDNAHARPFNVKGLPLPEGSPEIVPALKQLSRLKFGRDRAIIEAEIKERAQKQYSAGATGPSAPDDLIGESIA